MPTALSEFSINKKLRTAAGIAAVCMAVLAFVITVIRAAHTEITYDESYTYLYYVRDMRFSSLPRLFFDSQTNNHPLNSLLIWMVQVVSNTYYNEFLIRLPNVLFYAGFLMLALYMLFSQRIPFWVYTLLVLQYYLNEFFGLARGYGLAVFFVLAGLLFYMRWRQAETPAHGWLVLCFASFALGALSITFVLLVLLPFGLCALWHLLRQKQLAPCLKKYWFPMIPIATMCLLALAYQFISTRNTGFTPGGHTGPAAFYHALFGGFARSLIDRTAIASVLTVLLFVFFVGGCVLFFRRLGGSCFVLPFLLQCGVHTVLATLGVAVPDGRGFLVFYPGMLFALWELAGWCKEALAQHLKPGRLRACLAPAAGAVTTVLAAAAFFLSVNVHITHDWYDNYGIRERLYYVYANRLEADSLADSKYNSVFFYREKIIHEFGYDFITGVLVEE